MYRILLELENNSGRVQYAGDNIVLHGPELPSGATILNLIQPQNDPQDTIKRDKIIFKEIVSYNF